MLPTDRTTEKTGGAGAPARVRGAVRDGGRAGWRLSLWLMKFMVPVSLAVALLDRFGVLRPLAGRLEPVFRLAGLPGEAAVVFLTGALVNLYAAVAVLGPLGLDARQVTILAFAMLTSHNLPIETVVQHKAGTPAWGILLLRLSASLIGALFLNRVLPAAGAAAALAPAPVLAPAAAGAFLPFLAGWLAATALFTGRIVLIVIAVIVFQRLLDEFNVLPMLARLLGPFMRVLGLPPAAAFLWTVCNTLGIAYGAVVILAESRSGRLNQGEIDLANRSVAVCHSLLEDTLLFVAVGAWAFWLTVPRLVLAALVAWGVRLWRLAVGRARRPRAVSALALCACLVCTRPAGADPAPPAEPPPSGGAPALVSERAWTQLLAGGEPLRLPAVFPGEATLTIPVGENWQTLSAVAFRLAAAGEAPGGLKTEVFIKDRDWWWYHVEIAPPAPGEAREVVLDLTGAGGGWTPDGHRRPWNAYSAELVREIGLKLRASGPGALELALSDFRALPAAPVSVPAGPLPRLEPRPSSAEVPRYGRFELAFEVPLVFANPFDPDEVAIDACFTGPDGRETRVPAFFYQAYYFAGPGAGHRDDLRPAGAPEWRVRFAPGLAGAYRYHLEMSVGGAPAQAVSAPGHFRAVPSGHPGFVRVSGRDPRWFEHGDGRFFYPLGHNIRSPWDTRYSDHRRVPLAAPGGTLEVERWLDAMAASGQNFFETWMAAWWLGLEWLEGVDAYRGLGRYNLENAWKLDWLVEQAARRGIYIQLVVVNHGAKSTFCDQEWQDNPYNAARGGFLASPEEFFTDERARALFRRRLRYIVARWSYSPHVFAWELLNEMNLVGASGNFYRRAALTEWYREMGGWLKRIDPWARPITGHYTILYDSDIFRLPEVDYVITNAYYGGDGNIVDTLRQACEYNARFGKPQFVSEFGGNWNAGSDDLLTADLHHGLWAGYHLPFAGSPLFWWHNLIEDLGLYESFRALAAYHAGEDRPADGLKPLPALVRGENPFDLRVLALGAESRAIAWFYPHKLVKAPVGADGPPVSAGLTASLAGLEPGIYLLDFWDTRRGERFASAYASAGERLEFDLPAAARDFALKARRVGQGAAGAAPPLDSF